MVVLDEHFVLENSGVNKPQNRIKWLLLLSVYQYYEMPWEMKSPGGRRSPVQ